MLRMLAMWKNSCPSLPSSSPSPALLKLPFPFPPHTNLRYPPSHTVSLDACPPFFELEQAACRLISKHFITAETKPLGLPYWSALLISPIGDLFSSPLTSGLSRRCL